MAIDREPPKRIRTPSEKAVWQYSPFEDLDIGRWTRFPERWRRADPFQPRSDDTAEVAIGRILASAIKHGALLNRDHWQAWLACIAEVEFWNDLTWITFCPDGDSGRPCRWFADPITANLLNGFKRTTCYSPSLDPSIYLEKFIQQSYLDPCSVELFYAAAKVKWHLRLPPVLVDQALGRLPSIALSEIHWRKSIGYEKWVEKSDRRKSPASQKERWTILREWEANSAKRWGDEHRIFEIMLMHNECGSANLRRWKSVVASLMERKARKRRNSCEPMDIRVLLPIWVARRLRQRRRARSPKGLSPKVVRDRFSTLTALLFEEVSGDTSASPFLLSISELDERSKKVRQGLNEVDTELVEEAVKDFRSFLSYVTRLETKWTGEMKAEDYREFAHVLEENEADANDESYSQTRVSAWIISPEIYGKVLDEAVKGNVRFRDNDRICPSARELVIATILAFRAGLRLPETIGLRTGDFVSTEGVFEIHLDHTKMRRLKTFHSRRIVPLDVLCTPLEIRLIKDWLAPRKEISQQVGRNCNCFGPPISDCTPPIGPYYQAFEQIFENLGHPFLAYRHFRHSFATYLFTTLLLPSSDVAKLVPARLNSVISWDRKVRSSGRFLGQERHGQSALHAVSLALGHTGIYRTLESYQHLLDLSLGLSVSDGACVDESLQNALYLNGSIHNSRKRSQSGSAAKARSTYQLPKSDGRHLAKRSVKFRFWRRKTEREWLERAAISLVEWEACLEAAWNRQRALERADWSVLWLASSLTEAQLTSDGLQALASTAQLQSWREITKKISSRGFMKVAKGAAYSLPKGAQSIFELNRFWNRYDPKGMDDEVRDAISRFIGNYDRSNGGARMGTVKSCFVLEDFFLSSGLDQDFLYHGPEKPRVPSAGRRPQAGAEYCLSLQHFVLDEATTRAKGYREDRKILMKGRTPSVRVRWTDETGNKKLEGDDKDPEGATNEVEVEPLERNSDLARWNKTRKKTTESEAPHRRHALYAFKLFVSFVAAVEGIEPLKIDGRRGTNAPPPDFRIRS